MWFTLSHYYACIHLWLSSIAILLQPCLGLSVATSVRVGNELGAGNPQGAKRVTLVSVMITCKS